MHLYGQTHTHKHTQTDMCCVSSQWTKCQEMRSGSGREEVEVYNKKNKSTPLKQSGLYVCVCVCVCVGGWVGGWNKCKLNDLHTL